VLLVRVLAQHKGTLTIVFCHGWPLSADDWDTHMLFFL
jgi:non-heme chloroperoxidase